MPKIIKTNFAVGELAPQMFGRIDLSDKYLGGCSALENYIPLPQGGLARRPGTRFLKELDSGKTYRLWAYTPSVDKSYLLVFRDLELHVYRAYDVLSTYGDYAQVLGEPLQKLVSPFQASNLINLKGTPIKTEDDDYVCVFVDGLQHPQALSYEDDIDEPFTFGPLNFTSHAFRTETKNNNILTLTEEQWVMKLVSSNATEFTDLTAPYVEWRKDNEWVLGRVLTTSTTPAAPADPAENVCYVEPITAIVSDIAENARLVVLDSAYDRDDIPSGKRHVRSDTLVFNYSLEGAYVRVKSEYSEIRTSASSGSSYAAGGIKHGKTMWLRIESYLGTYDYPTVFIDTPVKADLTVGETYEILRSGFSIDNYASMKENAIDWDNAFTYSTVGDTFSCQNHFRVTASGGELANLSKSSEFDVVECSPEVSYYSCTGVVTVSSEYETEGHTGKLLSERNFFYTESNPQGVEVGQYILAEQSSKNFVLYKVTEITDELLASVVIADGTLKREDNSSELINGGQTSSYRVSEWSTGNYPRSVAWYERRLVFAGCKSAPEALWMSRVTDVFDFRTVDSEGGVTDDAGITYPLGGKTMNKIVNVTTGPVLLTGTESSIWQMRKSYEGEAITPSNISITEEAADGCWGDALRIGSSVIFMDLSRQRLMELVYNYEINGFNARNMNILADHLFENERIVRMCYQHRPHGIIWVVSDAGNLFSITYDSQQGVYAWARHTTEGKFLDVVLLQNPSEVSGYDRVVFLTDRNNGHLCLEMLENFYQKNESEANRGFFFLDCCVRNTPPVVISTDMSVISEAAVDFLVHPTDFTGAYVRLEVETQLRILLADTDGELLLDTDGEYLAMPGDPFTTVTLSVNATGTGVLSYQWLFEGVPIHGATEKEYSFTLAESYYGKYVCVVSNTFGAAATPVYFVNRDTVADLSVFYQWYFRALNASDFTPVPGATSNRLALEPITNRRAGYYYCRAWTAGAPDEYVNSKIAKVTPSVYDVEPVSFKLEHVVLPYITKPTSVDIEGVGTSFGITSVFLPNIMRSTSAQETDVPEVSFELTSIMLYNVVYNTSISDAVPTTAFNLTEVTLPYIYKDAGSIGDLADSSFVLTSVLLDYIE